MMNTPILPLEALGAVQARGRRLRIAGVVAAGVGAVLGLAGLFFFSPIGLSVAHALTSIDVPQALLDSLSHAASASSGGLPFDDLFTTLQQNITGPFLFTGSVIAVIAAGGVMIFGGGDMSPALRSPVLMVLAIAFMVCAANIVSGITGAGDSNNPSPYDQFQSAVHDSDAATIAMLTEGARKTPALATARKYVLAQALLKREGQTTEAVSAAQDALNSLGNKSERPGFTPENRVVFALRAATHDSSATPFADAATKYQKQIVEHDAQVRSERQILTVIGSVIIFIGASLGLVGLVIGARVKRVKGMVNGMSDARSDSGNGRHSS